MKMYHKTEYRCCTGRCDRHDLRRHRIRDGTPEIYNQSGRSVYGRSRRTPNG